MLWDVADYCTGKQKPPCVASEWLSLVSYRANPAERKDI